MGYRDVWGHEDIIGERMREWPVSRARGSDVIFSDEITQSGVFQHVDACGIWPKIEISCHDERWMNSVQEITDSLGLHNCLWVINLISGKPHAVDIRNDKRRRGSLTFQPLNMSRDGFILKTDHGVILGAMDLMPAVARDEIGIAHE